MDDILKQALVFERKNLMKALIAGLLSIIFLFAIMWIWKAILGYFPPVAQKEYELVGVMGPADFGDNKEGSQNVNNFFQSSPTPGDGTPGHSAPNPNQNNTATSNPVTENPVIVKSGPSETQASNNTNTNPNPNNSSTSNSNDTQGTGGTSTNTGANDGQGTGVGNEGDPKATVLSDGMFAISGLGNRKYLSLTQPVYTAQQEAVLTFEFVIAPEGNVKYVKAPVTSNTALKKAGMDAIYKWKFEPIDSDQDQTSKVTITFRLK